MVERELGRQLIAYFDKIKNPTEEEKRLLRGIKSEMGYYCIYPMTTDDTDYIANFSRDEMEAISERVLSNLTGKIQDEIEKVAYEMAENEEESHKVYARDETTGAYEITRCI